MNKNQKLDHLLAGLGDFVTIGMPEEVTDGRGRKFIQIPVTNLFHIRQCPGCGSPRSNICDSGSTQWAWHVPQGKRMPCKVSYHRERYICTECGLTYMEDIPWVLGSTHITMPLYECIRDDLRQYCTKKEVARVNCVSVHYVDIVVESLRPPITSHLPEVVCLDETHSEVEEHRTGSERNAWIKFTTNLRSRMRTHFDACPELKDAYAMLQYFHEISDGIYSPQSRIKELCFWISKFSKSNSDPIYRAGKCVSDHLSFIQNA